MTDLLNPLYWAAMICWTHCIDRQWFVEYVMLLHFGKHPYLNGEFPWLARFTFIGRTIFPIRVSITYKLEKGIYSIFHYPSWPWLFLLGTHLTLRRQMVGNHIPRISIDNQMDNSISSVNLCVRLITNIYECCSVTSKLQNSYKCGSVIDKH